MQQYIWRLQSKRLQQRSHTTRSQQVCDQCRNHDDLIPKRGHDNCPNSKCNCKYCKLTYLRRKLLRVSNKIRRRGITQPPYVHKGECWDSNNNSGVNKQVFHDVEAILRECNGAKQEIDIPGKFEGMNSPGRLDDLHLDKCPPDEIIETDESSSSSPYQTGYTDPCHETPLLEPKKEPLSPYDEYTSELKYEPNYKSESFHNNHSRNCSTAYSDMGAYFKQEEPYNLHHNPHSIQRNYSNPNHSLQHPNPHLHTNHSHSPQHSHQQISSHYVVHQPNAQIPHHHNTQPQHPHSPQSVPQTPQPHAQSSQQHPQTPQPHPRTPQPQPHSPHAHPQSYPQPHNHSTTMNLHFQGAPYNSYTNHPYYGDYYNHQSQSFHNYQVRKYE